MPKLLKPALMSKWFNGLLAVAATVFTAGCSPSAEAKPESPGYAVDVDAFANPPNEYRIIQYELNDGTLKKYPQYGIGGYLAFFYKQLYQQGPDGPSKIGPLVDAAKAKGMTVWLADDFGYPSGMAGGRVVAENPDYEVRGLAMKGLTGHGAEAVTLDLPGWGERFVSAEIYPVVDGVRVLDQGRSVPVEEKRIDAEGLEGDWELCAFVRVLRQGQAASTVQQFGHTGHYPDLLNPDATARFLANMHEPILAQIDDPASKVEGFYANEPNLMELHWKLDDVDYACVPWNPALSERFEAMHGYDLMPKLVALYGGDDLESRRVRIHFQQTVAAMLAENFAGVIRDWCHDHGLMSSGHFLLNEYLSMHVASYGDLMHFVSQFDVPALDIGIPNPDSFMTFPYSQTRLFSSVGAWKEQKGVIILLDPIIGGGGLKRLSPAIPLLLNATNMAFLNGANMFTSYLPLDPSDNGRTKAAGYTPEAYRAFNDYVGRISSVLRGADRDARVALYYPIAMFQADYIPEGRHWTKIVPEYEARQQEWDAIEKNLLDARIEYTIIHPDAVADAVITGEGEMKIGSGSYQYLVMPEMEIIPAEVLEKIVAFETAGGVVLWVDAVPKAGEYAEEDGKVAYWLSEVEPLRPDDLPGEIDERTGTPFDLKFMPEGTDQLAVARYRRGDKAIYFLVNRTGGNLAVSVTAGSEGEISVLDPTTGGIAELPLPASLRLEPHRSLILLR